MRPVVPLEFPIEIGDIGTIAGDGSWRPITTVRHRFNSYPARIQRTGLDGEVWTVYSGEDVVFETYGNGELSPLIAKQANAKARVEIQFGSHDAFVFAARGVTIRAAVQLDDMIDKIHLAYHLRRQRPEDGRWYKEFTFVFTVADAERFTALLAKRDGARVAIMRRGPQGPPSSPERLASVISLGTGSEDLQATNQRDARGRFYRAYKLRPEVLERWREEPFTHSRGIITFAWPTPSFEETFAEI
ncbi:MAG: hypothetical protein WBC33_10825 [Conexibacter sp.]